MIQFNPQVADLLHRINLISQDIATRPNLGPYEVGVLEHLVELANELAGIQPEQPRYHYHHSVGRAIDLPSPAPLVEFLKRYRMEGRR